MLLAVVGLALYLGSFAYYISLVIRGGVSPNASTWLIWAFLGFANALTYLSLSGDWIKSTNAFGGALANALTFLIALKLGRFYRLALVDKVIAIIGLVAVAVWLVNKHAPYANGLVLSCVVISTIPTLRGVWERPNREKPLPWLLLAGSFIFPLLVVILRWQQAWDLMFPLTGLLTNGSVGLISLIRPNALVHRRRAP